MPSPRGCDMRRLGIAVPHRPHDTHHVEFANPLLRSLYSIIVLSNTSTVFYKFEL
jgi:hypothetical protein